MSTPPTSMLSELLAAQAREIERFMRLSEHWTVAERARVMVGWLGTVRAKAMNDHLELDAHGQARAAPPADPPGG